MFERISWEDFKNNEMVWFVNTILHVFGLAIVFDYDEDNNLKEVYPARCKFRGFPEDVNSKNYIKVTEYLKANIDDLMKDIEE